jgi:hypothetical protein
MKIIIIQIMSKKLFKLLKKMKAFVFFIKQFFQIKILNYFNIREFKILTIMENLLLIYLI